MGSTARAWLLFLSDPVPQIELPRRPLASLDVEILISAALLHGVLPGVLRGIRRAAPELATCDAWRNASVLLRNTAALCLALEHHGRRVLGSFREAGIDAAIVKGPAFARHSYPDSGWRPFGDIDILVPAAALPATRKIMLRQGFLPQAGPERAGLDYHEEQWLLKGTSAVLVEVQDNLVHSPSFGPGIHLTLEDLRLAGGGDPHGPAALLLTAATHGAIGHQCDRLRFLVDICQTARNLPQAFPVGRLVDIAVQCGLLNPVAAALDLAARTFRDPATQRMADAIGGTSLRRAACRLFWTPRSVLRAQERGRRRDSWKRKVVREIFKLPAGAQP
jgi:hypothetical protein